MAAWVDSVAAGGMAEAWGNASTDSIDSTTEANIFDVLAATSMMTSDSEG